MMLGEVDNVDGHFIATKFHALLVPTGSMYVVDQASSRSGNVTTMTWSGVPVKFNVKSALLAYPRVWLWMLAFAWPFLTHYGESLSSTPMSCWYTMGGMVAVAVLAHVPGRLSEREKKRLRILGEVTGMRLDPSKLMPWTRESKRDVLEHQLREMGIDTTPDGVSRACVDASPEVLSLLYGYARYAGDDADWRRVADSVLARHPRAA